MATKRSSPSRDFNKSNVEKVPQGKPVIYEIKDDKDENIYTGSAKRGRVQERLKEHLLGGTDPINDASSFQIKQKSSIGEAQQEEKKIIEKEKPKYNRQT